MLSNKRAKVTVVLHSEQVEWFNKQSRDFNISKYVREAIDEKRKREGQL
jgi:hypothetical protein